MIYSKNIESGNNRVKAKIFKIGNFITLSQKEKNEITKSISNIVFVDNTTKINLYLNYINKTKNNKFIGCLGKMNEEVIKIFYEKCGLDLKEYLIAIMPEALLNKYDRYKSDIEYLKRRYKSILKLSEILENITFIHCNVFSEEIHLNALFEDTNYQLIFKVNKKNGLLLLKRLTNVCQIESSGNFVLSQFVYKNSYC